MLQPVYLFSFYNQTCLWCVITHQYAVGLGGGGNTRQSHLWLDGRPRHWPVKFPHCFRWIPHGISLCWGCGRVPPQQPSVWRLPLDKPHVVIYPLMTTLGSERTVVPLSALLMTDISMLALMLFRKDLALDRGVNNRSTFVRRTKIQLSPCVWVSVENLRNLGGSDSAKHTRCVTNPNCKKFVSQT